MSGLSDSQAATVYEKGMEKTDVPYQTIDKFLSQILVAYSSAIQILGDPPNHSQIGSWFKAAIEANIYDAKRGIAVDLFRSEKTTLPKKVNLVVFRRHKIIALAHPTS